MISAVVPPQPLPQPQQPPSTPTSVRERAAAGYFRDIALWLNEPLVTQGIFVQVQADQRPGCLKLMVEFERSPIKDRLLRFLCHRVWQLNSELIEGIHVLARPVGWQRVLWQQRVRIVTPALKRRKAQDQLTQACQSGSPLPPQIRAPKRRPKRIPKQQLKTLRAFMLTGSAVAAFLLGCMLEVLTSRSSPTLPTFSAQVHTHTPDSAAAASADTRSGGAPPASREPVARRRSGAANLVNHPKPSLLAPARRADRPSVVDTALEPVGVIAHQKPTPVPADEVTLLFGGDVSLEDLDLEQLEAAGGLFAEVEDYFQADVSMVNLATPLATAATNLNEELLQKKRPDAVEVLVNSGIDIVNLTNSNLMQYGTEGLSETLNALDSKGLYRVGAGRNAVEARRPEILDVKGKRIAYLSYAMGGNNAAMDTTALKERAGASDAAVAREVENFKQSTAFKERAGFNAQNMPQIVEDLKAIRQEVDWIVVNFRWVDHLTEKPNFLQTNLARLAIDQGADVVVGYHPTVIQGAEIYKGRPIAYSLGDFVFKADQPVEDQDSAVLKVSLQEDQMRVEFVPVQVRDSRPKTLTGKAGEAVLERIKQASAQFERPMESPVVLDLKAPAPAPAETADPTSPFVTPEADKTLILEPESQAEPDSPVAPVLQQESPPAAPETTPAVDSEGLPSLDLQEQIDDELQEWGPKVSPKQKEFQPIPQNRSAAPEADLDAQLQPPLLRSLTAPAKANQATPLPSTAPGSDPWTDSVPAVPTPLEPALEEQTQPRAGSATIGRPGPAADPSSAAPSIKEGRPDTPAYPKAPEAIPAQAEPLVGPLGSVDEATSEAIALTTATHPATASPLPSPLLDGEAPSP
ncbi:MAG TPA: CapA family protein [Leptolyngbyaceae cyanobacterium M65_K2018_010]|nr:CapA family protein [Leptolyngbyaceae cyanobacterium M65_K2018_010]